ncbi:MAG TPA: BtrH N-terminal domain-containing protein [Bacteroidales bacterium]|jgi:hypothetical protein|nr:BtrH N-terminal domain-containing protein [Bacteroidales bacterium]HNW67975.1 BtrH N-terminal domain-containing protein [Bacteroidales bacterium]HPT52159.1 BtrH N-terminal domain-containing protein [Bacteroidales bacterium]
MEEFDILEPVHCETGTVRNILHYHGYEISEPMILGIGSGIMFAYVSIIKYQGSHVLVARPPHGSICRNFFKRMKIPYTYKYFAYFQQKKSMRELDRLLSQNIPVGVLTSVKDLMYLSQYERFGFNGHSVLVVKKENGLYKVVDNLGKTGELKTISPDDLQNARFNMSLPCISGQLYYVSEMPSTPPPIQEAIIKGIEKTCSSMLRSPIPLNGTHGIGVLAKYLRKRAAHFKPTKMRTQFLWFFRMLEIGSGGSGYRYIYADFLKETATIFNNESFLTLSQQMVKIADTWRTVSLITGRYSREGTVITQEILMELSDTLFTLQQMEHNLFMELEKLIKSCKNTMLLQKKSC